MYTLVVLTVFSLSDVDSSVDRAEAPQPLHEAIAAADARDWSKAQTAFEQVALRSPDSSDTLSTLGVAESLFRQGRFDEAGGDFEKLHKESTYATGQARALITLRWAQCLAHQGQWNECQAVAQQALQNKTGAKLRIPLTYLLGRCHSALGKHEAARATYLEVVRSTDMSQPIRSRAQWMIAHSYSMQGETDSARETFLRIEQTYSTDARLAAGALVEAGRCCEQRGQWNEAEAIYRRAVAKYAHAGSSDEARRRLAVVQIRMDGQRRH